mmetsp:Transcript_41732/g.76268  ORF Transcript_41732/g.76268 Transcript_41732/m.76268 type:complete len:112 (-) Transcript_41732:449-784(-)|eukprot:CAMPEP_0202026840 /NCGR_PEP_ID=MMETSP0905-20130828/59954_1 /ASSEMBLY_ACC=CAM_ASM_000554 /TAXON_ID=420261 /ORGANISM="Thalassiosira antarctica, Strain CCMP982" /LENGTH=111 /DNA_ID=CAMNT_0048590167 /DNA_START=28 /DNA_END=363 /DNA_ORIENTATION=-
MPNSLANNNNAAEVVSTQTTSKQDVLEDGTRVIHTTTIETYPDGSQCKRTVTRRIDTTVTEEQDVGRPMVSLSLRNFRMCCCLVPLGRKKKKGEEEEEEKKEGEEEKEEER